MRIHIKAGDFPEREEDLNLDDLMSPMRAGNSRQKCDACAPCITGTQPDGQLPLNVDPVICTPK